MTIRITITIDHACDSDAATTILWRSESLSPDSTVCAEEHDTALLVRATLSGVAQMPTEFRELMLPALRAEYDAEQRAVRH